MSVDYKLCEACNEICYDEYIRTLRIVGVKETEFEICIECLRKLKLIEIDLNGCTESFIAKVSEKYALTDEEKEITVNGICRLYYMTEPKFTATKLIFKFKNDIKMYRKMIDSLSEYMED